jgi:hypothetical protein
MSQAVVFQAPSAVRAPEESPAKIPWYVHSLLIASASALIGECWDVSWHISIGRDSFWTAPHLMIQFCAILGAFTCSLLILQTTFGKHSPLLEASVNVMGFRGPMGAFVVMWGAAAMLTSAPFDNWWHNAYGLDVKILSPPHVVLGLGIGCVQLGGLLLTLGCMNRAKGNLRNRLDWIFLCAGGLVLSQVIAFSQEYVGLPLMHSAIYYRALAIVAPLILIGVAESSEKRWAATAMAGLYIGLRLIIMLTLRQFPAQPKLGPVYNNVTHFVFPYFPSLIIVPAICFDILRQRFRNRSVWVESALLGTGFLVTLIAVQWPFATFLMSPHSRNWFFATADFPYYWPPTSPSVRHVFLYWEPTRALFWQGMFIALLAAIAGTRIGFGWSKWMRSVRR